MSLFDRLLLVFHSLVVAVLSAMVALAGAGAASLEWVWEAPHLRWAVAVIGLLLFLLSLRLLFSVMRRPKGEGVDRLTEFGYIRISLDTLESIAQRAARGVKGIRDLTARVRFFQRFALVRRHRSENHRGRRDADSAPFRGAPADGEKAGGGDCRGRSESGVGAGEGHGPA